MCSSFPTPIRGVGVAFVPTRADKMRVLAEDVDFFEVAPESFCDELPRSGGRPPQLRLHPGETEFAMSLINPRPLAVHGSALSIGSPGGFNDAYIAMLEVLATRYPFAWHSAHLSFSWIDGHHLGAQLPLPRTREAADMLSQRAREIQARIGAPFLLENTTHFLPDVPSETQWDEVEFLNEVAIASDCGLLIDIDALEDACRMRGDDPDDALERLDLLRVEQLHVRPDTERTDAQWRRLGRIVRRAPYLRGIVSVPSHDDLDPDHLAAFRRELRRLRELTTNTKQEICA